MIHVQDVDFLPIVKRDEGSEFGRRKHERFRVSDMNALTIVQVKTEWPKRFPVQRAFDLLVFHLPLASLTSILLTAFASETVL